MNHTLWSPLPSYLTQLLYPPKLLVELENVSSVVYLTCLEKVQVFFEEKSTFDGGILHAAQLATSQRAVTSSSSGGSETHFGDLGPEKGIQPAVSGPDLRLHVALRRMLNAREDDGAAHGAISAG